MTSQGHQMTDPAKMLAFLFAGKAFFTLRSLRTGTRYTYRVKVAKDNPKLFFVSYLTGSDNVSNYAYIGIVREQLFKITNKSKLPMNSPPVAGFVWLLQGLQKGELSVNCEFWHEGRCGRCGKKLTVPESIFSGFGPECIVMMGAVRPSFGKTTPAPLPVAALDPDVEAAIVKMRAEEPENFDWDGELTEAEAMAHWRAEFARDKQFMHKVLARTLTA